MLVKRAVFPAPKDCPPKILQSIFEEAGKKFVDAMFWQGYELKSDLDYYTDIALSNHDPNDNQYIIRGWFAPHIPEETFYFEDVPDRVVPELLRKYGRKMKVDKH